MNFRLLTTLLLCAYGFCLSQNLVAQYDYEFEYGIEERLPDLEMEDIDGDMLQVSDFGKNGKVTILKFWSSMSMGCELELEETAQICKKWSGDLDVEVVSVSVDHKGSSGKIQEYVKQYGWEFPMIIDPNDALLRTMGIRTNVLPYTVILDHKGKIVYKGLGEGKNKTEDRIQEIVDKARSHLPVVTIDELRARRQQEQNLRLQSRPTPSPATQTVSRPTPAPTPTPSPPKLVRATPEPKAVPPPVKVSPKPLPVPVPEPETVAEVPTPQPNRMPYVPALNGLPSMLGDRVLTTEKSISIDREEVEILIWDDQRLDGDVVSLYLNGVCLLKDYELTDKPYRIKTGIDLEDRNFLIMHAHNEGKFPPNTAAVSIICGDRRENLTMSSNMKNSDAVELKLGNVDGDVDADTNENE